MDRIDFLHSVDTKEGLDFANTIIGFFDQLMALYSLVGSYLNMRIINESTSMQCVFVVSFENPFYIDQLIQAIQSTGSSINIYNRQMMIRYAKLSETDIRIEIQ